MLDQLNEIEKTALETLESVHDQAALEAWRVASVGRSSPLMQVFAGLGKLSKEERPAVGAAANRVKVALESALAERAEAIKNAALAKSLEEEQLDNLTAQSVSTSQINLDWQDNSTNETDFHIEESATGPTSGFSDIDTVGAGITHYERTGRTGGTQYWNRVRAHNTSDYSAYSNVANAITQGDIATPSNLTLYSAKGDEVELTFQDNSNDEDYHSIERKTGSGGTYAEVKQLEPNRTYWKETSRTAGETYYYQIRAKQGLVYSNYCSEKSITTLTTPATPTGLTIESYADTWQRLTWAKVNAAQGYKIYRSTNGTNFSKLAPIWMANTLLVMSDLPAGPVK